MCHTFLSEMAEFNFNDLPNECIALVFEKLSLRELMPLELVAHRWKDILELTFRTRTSLNLISSQFDWSTFGSLTFLQTDDANTLSIDVINESMVQFLLLKFPLITSIGIHGCFIDMSLFATLLGGWSVQLTSITFLAQFVNRWDLSSTSLIQTQRLVKEMQSLKSLKHLFLDVPIPVPLFALLPQLETLYYREITEPDADQIYDGLLVHLTDKLTSLHLLCPTQILSSERIRESLPVIVSRQMKRLSLATVDQPMMTFLCRHFTSLTHIDLALTPGLTLINLLPQLNHLKHLTNLRLANPLDTHLFFPFYKITTRNYRRRLQPNFTVTTLHLNLELKRIRMAFLDHMFPMVQRITFNGRVFRCECLFHVPNVCRRCSDDILNCLRQFNSLRQVYHDTRLLMDFQEPNSIPPNILDNLFIE